MCNELMKIYSISVNWDMMAIVTYFQARKQLG